MRTTVHEMGDQWTLESYHIICGNGERPKVTLRLRHGTQEYGESMECGDGPVDAIFLAIERLTGVSTVCRDFRVHSVTVGKDAQGEVNVEVEHQGALYRGRGVSTDSVEASAKAFLNAINKIAVAKGGRMHPQHS